ncbi:TrbG/VirB9 family P-type conjugative transfer protein [Chromobacterium haemolyticum]|uniref:TrbG/VirB9 family P-type conjugative transfer protein n=1 Tax=Chromobacterium fluminis TaxID=3044269 RepID=A0ABX0L0S1_9NEIS|nr:TrbG/VirB9 family P-type conjugative transfer protein [Chromobacterium haemolyticum]NHR04538.1 TrbG/VirB9 family P-type conjugative transfer protein [Chromobacterium haemolyticum]
MITRVLGLLLAGSALWATQCLAAAPVVGQAPISMPADTRLVVFPFDPNNSFTIISRPNAITDIQLGPDEQLVALAAGDSTQWTFHKTDGHIFVKPIRADLFTSATLVTSKRTYQLTLRSVSDRAKWYQRVSWQYPDLVLLGDPNFKAPSRAMPPDIDFQSNSSGSIGSFGQYSSAPSQGGMYGEKLNFNYAVKGSADFAPKQVFDDGKFTWFRIVGSQEFPAVFMINADSDIERVNWLVKGEFLIVQRLAPAFLLKIGKEEVRIVRKG